MVWVWFGELSSFWSDTFVHHVVILMLSTEIWCPPTRTSNSQDWKQRGIWLVQRVMREDLAICGTQGHCHQLQSCHLTYYCWWLKSCTTKDDYYPIISRVLTCFNHPRWLAGFLNHQQYPISHNLLCVWCGENDSVLVAEVGHVPFIPLTGPMWPNGQVSLSNKWLNTWITRLRTCLNQRDFYIVYSYAH